MNNSNKRNDPIFNNLLNLQNANETGISHPYASYIKSLYDLQNFENKQEIKKILNENQNEYFEEKEKAELLQTGLLDIIDNKENKYIRSQIMDTDHNEDFTLIGSNCNLLNFFIIFVLIAIILIFKYR
jgi:hypothetical protein